MNELVEIQPNDAYFIDLENPEMISKAIAGIANAFIRASELAGVVKELQNKLKEVEAKAEAAMHQKEIADQAYNAVNAQRIDAENQAHALRAERNELEGNNERLLFEIGDVKAKVTSLEADIIRLKEDHERTLESITSERNRALDRIKELEEFNVMYEVDNKKLQGELDAAKSALLYSAETERNLRAENEKLRRVIDRVNSAMKGEDKANSHWVDQPRDDEGRWASDRHDSH